MFLVAKKFNFPYKVMWTLKKTLRIKDFFCWLVIRIRILTRIDSVVDVGTFMLVFSFCWIDHIACLAICSSLLWVV
jgi:hypothetical protein